MIHWLLYGVFMLGIGWFLRMGYEATGGRNLLPLDPGLSPLDRHGNRMVEGELAAPAEFIMAAGFYGEDGDG